MHPWPLIAALALTGCASSIKPAPSVPAPPIPAVLLQPCPPLPPLETGETKHLAAHLYLTSLAYADCKARHQALADAARNREKN